MPTFDPSIISGTPTPVPEPASPAPAQEPLAPTTPEASIPPVPAPEPTAPVAPETLADEYNSIIYSNLSDAFEGNVTLEEAAKNIDEQANSTLFAD